MKINFNSKNFVKFPFSPVFLRGLLPVRALIKVLFMTVVVTVNFLLFSCHSQERQGENYNKVIPAGQQYTCPMHAEVVSDKQGECPKCKMDLVLKKDALKKEYYLAYSASAANTESGRPVTFTFIPRLRGDDNSIVNLDVVHTKKIHLIIVSSDLSFFNHIHPEVQPDGSYQVDETFPAGGKYILFADYTPEGEHRVERIEVNVSGKIPVPKNYTQSSLESKTGGYQISVTSQSGDFVSNQMTMMNATVKKDGMEIPAASLDDYLGAKAHMVIVSGDGQTYLHVHPELEDGKLLLHTEFPHIGMYRGWIQVQVNGKVLTGDFVFIVTRGRAGTDNETKTEHQHH